MGSLRALGAEALLLPAIEVALPADPEPLRRAANEIERFDWIIFTSANAVEAFSSCLERKPDHFPQIATVGEATRRTCEEHGLNVALTPDKYVAEALVAALSGQEIAGSRVLIPSAAVTRDVVPVELRRLGAQVDVVEAYRNIVPAEAVVIAEQLLREPYPDWITFASSSAVQNIVGLVGAERVNRMRVATIGPVTAATGRSLGVAVTAEAGSFDAPGLVQAIVKARTYLQ